MTFVPTESGWLTTDSVELCQTCRDDNGHTYTALPMDSDHWDTPRHCDLCGILLDVPLSQHGLAYVAEYAECDSESAVVRQWINHYPAHAHYLS